MLVADLDPFHDRTEPACQPTNTPSSHKMPSTKLQQTYDDPGISDRYETIRSAVRQMEPDDIARQLPHLIDLVRTHSWNDEPTVRFVIGISFSQNQTLLDYRLDRIADFDDSGQPRYETLKPPVQDSHFYLVFAYPSDPQFDATTLRGALLTAIEDEATEMRSSSTQTEAGRSADKPDSSLGKLIRKLGLGASWLSSPP